MPLFLVRRIVGREYPGGQIPKPHEQYLVTFTDRAAAEHEAKRRDLAMKLATDPAALADEYPGEDYLDPFSTDSWESISSLPPAVLRDWLRDEGVEPPPELEPGQTVTVHEYEWAERRRREKQGEWADELGLWANWWDALRANPAALTRSQWERFWLGLDRDCWFEVAECPTDGGLVKALPTFKKPPVVYAVVASDWQYNDQHYGGSNDLLLAYRTFPEAERARRKAEADAFEEQRRNEYDSRPRFVVVELPLDQVAEG